jgi:multicomponent Na+:H+ antiporter subunit G
MARDVVVAVFVVTGLGFSLSGAVGILRMPDVYTRIQCSSKAVTMGALPLLVALVIAEGPLTAYGGRALLVAFLLMVLNPLASHALARAAYKTGVPMWEGSVIDQPRERHRPPTEER